jgi:hypothetical protein
MIRDFIRRQLLEDLAKVEGHIVSSEINVSAQRNRVEGNRTGSAVLSLSLLRTFEATLRVHYDHRDRILRELKGWGRPRLGDTQDRGLLTRP